MARNFNKVSTWRSRVEGPILHKKAGVRMQIGRTYEDRLSSQANQPAVRFHGANRDALPWEPQPAACGSVHILRAQMDQCHSAQRGLSGKEVWDIPPGTPKGQSQTLAARPHRACELFEQPVWGAAWVETIRQVRDGAEATGGHVRLAETSGEFI